VTYDRKMTPELDSLKRAKREAEGSDESASWIDHPSKRNPLSERYTINN
jgi:hypothetical protein